MPDPQKPADMPAGHKRDEAKREVKDHLEEEIATRQEQDEIEPIDQAKLGRRDNEILGQLDHEGSIPIENAESGKRYVFLTAADGYPDNAKSAIRNMHATAKRMGFTAVQGPKEKNPVGANLISNDVASGTTLRAVGDTVLFEQTEEMARAMERESQRKMDKQMAIEENSVVYASQVLGRAGLPNTMHGAAGDFSRDPLLSRAAGAAGHSETFGYNPNRTMISDNDVRLGRIRGPSGTILPPGYETRRMR